MFAWKLGKGIIMIRLSISAAAMLAANTVLAAPLTGIGGSQTGVPTGVTEGFETATPGIYTVLDLGFIKVSGDDSKEFVIGDDYIGDYNTRGTLSLYNERVSSRFTSITFTFTSTVSAFAFNFGASDGIWTLDAFDSGMALIESLTISPVMSSNAGDYFGIAAPGIKHFRVSQRNCIVDCPVDFVFIDDITYLAAGSDPVPAPAALALFGLGVAALGLARRR